jgi:hypothetical protein
MPKLPDRSALGAPSVLRGRPMADFPGVNTSASAEGAIVGDGISGLGNTLGKVASAEFEADTARRKKARQEDDSLDLIKADAYHEKHLADAERQFDTDPNFKDYELKFQPLAGTITEDAAKNIRNPKLREKWLLTRALSRNESARGRILDRGTGLARQAKEVEVEDALKTFGSVYADPNADDERRSRVLGDMDATVSLAEKSGLLLPNRAQAIREKYIDGALISDAERRLFDDPEGLLDELENPKSVRYARLTPEHRRALITRTRIAQSAVTQQDVGDDIERIRRTGKAPVGSDGRTSLDRASRFLTPNQTSKLNLAWNEAQMEYQAVAPLFNMSEEEAVDHLASIIPAEGQDDESYRSAVRVETKANAAWRRIKELRDKDPAAAVAQSPEVKSVEDLIEEAMRRDAMAAEEGGTLLTENQLNPLRTRTMLLEARKDAQRRLGLKEWELRPITRQEAETLLDMPEPSSMEPGEYVERLQAAAKRAEDIYGPEYAKEVLKAAISFQRRDKEEKEISAGILADMARGEVPPESAFRRASELSDIDRVGRVFDAPELDANRPVIAQPPINIPMGGQARIAAPGRAITPSPNPAQIDWLMVDPQTRASTFDRMFGAGAAAKVIGKASKPTKENPRR